MIRSEITQAQLLELTHPPLSPEFIKKLQDNIKLLEEKVRK